MGTGLVYVRCVVHATLIISSFWPSDWWLMTSYCKYVVGDLWPSLFPLGDNFLVSRPDRRWAPGFYNSSSFFFFFFLVLKNLAKPLSDFPFGARVWICIKAWSRSRIIIVLTILSRKWGGGRGAGGGGGAICFETHILKKVPIIFKFKYLSGHTLPKFPAFLFLF